MDISQALHSPHLFSAVGLSVFDIDPENLLGCDIGGAGKISVVIV